MAQINKELNNGQFIGNTNTELLVVGSGKTAIVTCIHITNVTTNATKFSLYFVPSGESVADRYCHFKNIDISGEGYFQNISPKVLSSGGKIIGIANNNNSLAIHISGVEVS